MYIAEYVWYIAEYVIYVVCIAITHSRAWRNFVEHSQLIFSLLGRISFFYNEDLSGLKRNTTENVSLRGNV